MDAAVETKSKPDMNLQHSSNDAPAGSVGDSTKTLFNYIVPRPYLSTALGHVAWSNWYGSTKAVSEAAEALLRLRSPELVTIRALATQNAPKGVSVPPHAILLCYLGIAEHREPVAQAMGEAFARIDLSSRLDANLNHILGSELKDQLRLQAQCAPAAELVRSIQKSFPILSSLYSAGGFSRRSALPLLHLGALVERLADFKSKPSQTERNRIEMAISVLLTDLPPHVPALVMSTSDHIKSVFPLCVKLQSVMDETREPLDPSRPLSEQLSEESFGTILQRIIAYHGDLPALGKVGGVMPR